MTEGAKASLILVAVLSFVLPSAAHASASEDRELTRRNRDITVPAGESADSATCLNCSVHVRGKIAGDVTAFHGNVTIEAGGSVGGDVATFLGDVRVENNAEVGGDVAALGGRVSREPNGKIGGDQAAYGRFWFFVGALIPFVFPGLLITLIVWLVRRNRRPSAVPA